MDVSWASGRFVDYCGLKLFVPQGHFDEPVLAVGGMPESHVMALFERMEPKGWTVLDIGANIGTHTVKLSTLIGPSGTVFAVEADIDNAAALRLTLLENDLRNVALLVVAASDQVGVLAATETHKTNSVFMPVADLAAMTKMAASLPIDAVISRHVNLIKIDIEGAELVALRGMQNLIGRCRPPIVMEFSPSYIQHTLGSDRSLELLEFFSSRNYGCLHLNFAGDLVHLPTASDVIQLSAREQAAGWNHVDLLFLPAETFGQPIWTGLFTLSIEKALPLSMT